MRGKDIVFCLSLVEIACGFKLGFRVELRRVVIIRRGSGFVVGEIGGILFVVGIMEVVFFIEERIYNDKVRGGLRGFIVT